MFGKPIQDVELAEIVSFLETGVREGTALDFKREFPSNLEKTLAAFANTYGGVVLIGVDETESGASVLPILGVGLRPGLRERVLQKALEAIHPPLLPEVSVFEFKSNPSLTESDRALIVVNVAESADAPHSIDQRTAVYLRGDNVSTRTDRRATVGEIEWLLKKRQRSLELKERLILESTNRAETLRTERRARHTKDHYWKDGELTLTLVPVFPRQPFLTPPELFQAAERSRVQANTPLHFLPIGRIQRVRGGLFFHSEDAFSEYQTQGLILHQFDYWWDYLELRTVAVRRQLYPSATAALFTSVFQNAIKLYQQTDFRGTLEFAFRATGLEGAFFASPRRTPMAMPLLTESEIRIGRTFSIVQLEARWREIAIECQRELYWAFGFDARDEWLNEDFERC